jgi:hypothetical protein
MLGIRKLKMVVPATLAVFAGTLVCASASALAAAPETPETVKPATGITATSATLHGVLNPGAAGEVGSYQFSYEQSGSVCTPGGTLDPSAPAFAKGIKGEAVSVTVTGLEPDKEYAFCVIAYNLAAEPADGAAVPFKTLPLPPKVDGESASVTSTSAILDAQVNSENQETGYSFEYATSEAELGTQSAVTVVGNMLSALDEDQDASVSTSTLQPDTTYYYRVLAKNISSEEKVGPIKSFTTVPVPHTDAATAVTATTAMLHGHFTPDAIETKYSFEYNDTGECANGGSTTPTKASTGTVSAEVTGLQPGATYTVCFVTSDVFGSEVDEVTPMPFKTLAAAPEISGETGTPQSPFAETLEATVDPNFQVASCEIEYGETTSYGTSMPCSPESVDEGPQPVSLSVTGLESAKKYYFRVVATNGTGKTTGTGEFTTTTAQAPIVEGESYSFLTGTGVTLNAQINPSYQATTYAFEYATDPALLGKPGAITVPGGSIPAGGEGQSVNVHINEQLTPGTPYFYRVIAKNAAGTKPGTTETFTTPTPPNASTGAAEDVTRNSATVSGMVNPEGQETQYTIQYGPTASYGYSTPPVNLGSEVTPIATGAVVLSWLVPDTTYHYRIVAVNSAGESAAGADGTFTTEPGPPLPPSTGEEASPVTPTPTGAAPVGSTFPNLTAIAPLPGPKETAVEAPATETKSLTRAQKLNKALKACRRAKGKRRASCEKRAHRQYGPKPGRGKQGKS